MGREEANKHDGMHSVGFLLDICIGALQVKELLLRGCARNISEGLAATNISEQNVCFLGAQNLESQTRPSPLPQSWIEI